MPIQIESQEFEDVFGNILTYYQANPGDLLEARFIVRSAIRISSVNNPLTYDPVLQQMTSPTQSWLEEGFRVGKWVFYQKYNNQGSGLGQGWTQVNYVDDFVCDFDSFPASLMPDTVNGESLEFRVVEGNGSFISESRADLDVLYNEVVNSSSGSPQSLIDGEVTRVSFYDVDLMVPTDTISAAIIQNQSGQYLKSAELQRNADGADGWLRHELRISFAQSGAYNPEWFDSSDCLKSYLKLEWAALSSEPFQRATAIFDFNSDTGWFNQAHNTSLANSTLVQGIDELNYCAGKVFQVTVDGPVNDIGIGAQYISIDPAYYKNRPYSQRELTMLIPTSPAVSGTLYTSETNEFGAYYTLHITNIATVGTETTITGVWAPTGQFSDFMNAREDDDRLFYLWIKCGNANLLAFEGQLTCNPVVTGPLTMIQDFGYLDHSENITNPAGNQTGFIADTEDDIAYFGTFLLEKGEDFDSLNVKLEAYNSATGDSFTLQPVNFSFSGVQVSSDGRYLLNETATSNTTLPLTSQKRQFFLALEPTLDTGNQYGVKLYAPWLLDWKYWIQKTGVNSDFYPNQTENWEQYDDLSDWFIRTKITLIQDNFGFIHTNVVKVEPYNNEDDIDSSIEILQEPSLTVLQAIPIGEIVRLKSTHVKQTGVWDQALTWGMLTVEPFESGPRWICSSEVDFDNNTQNPLTPISGSLIIISYPQPDTAVLECFFDSSKIDMTNGVKFTAKIKEKDADVTDFMITDIKQFTRSFSVMKTSLDTVYSGPIMTVRRSSDNTEQDFTAIFNGTNWIVDTAAILLFVGNTETDQGYVARWFDQSGNGLPATQSVANNQPQIVLNGSIITDPDNGLPALDFDGIDDFFDMPVLGSTADILHAMQYRRSQGTTTPFEFSIGATEGSNSLPYCLMHVNGNSLYNGIFNAGGVGNPHQIDTTPVVDSFLNVLWRRSIDNNVNMVINGVSVPVLNGADNLSTNYNKIGDIGFPGWIHNGLMQELNTSDTNINETLVQNNMNYRFQTF